MFGVLISGRLVDTNFREVDPTHVVIDILEADKFNHVVVSTNNKESFSQGTYWQASTLLLLFVFNHNSTFPF